MWLSLNESEKLEAVRKFIDVEDAEASAGSFAFDAYRSIEQSRSEQFLQRIAQAIDAVLRDEIIRTPTGKAFVPERFIVFLNPTDERALQGKKREFVRQELAHIIFEEARRRAADNELTAEKIEIEFRLDGTLEADELRVSAIFEDSRELTVVTDNEKTVVFGEQNFKTILGKNTQTANEPLYKIEIWENEKQTAAIPVYKQTATIGRGTSSLPVEIPLRTAAVSRRHAVLEKDENGKFWITHIGANPTLLGGVELAQNVKTPLDENQKIEICGYTLGIKPL